MKCDGNCDVCTRPVEKCYGGGKASPYADRKHLPIWNGERRRRSIAVPAENMLGVSCGRRVACKEWEGMTAR